MRRPATRLTGSNHDAPKNAAPDIRALREAEHGPGIPPTGPARLRLALCYPNTYHVGMSSLGFQIAWQTIHAVPGMRVERYFTDTVAQGSIESGAQIANCNAILISGAYEMDDPNVVDLIEAAGLPLEARRRGSDTGEWPLIVMGGVLISVNRMPIYPFVDVFCHGEAEVILPPMLAALGNEDLSRAELLRALAAVPGIEVTAGARLAEGLEVTGAQREALDSLGGLQSLAGSQDAAFSARSLRGERFENFDHRSEEDGEANDEPSIDPKLFPVPAPARLNGLCGGAFTSRVLTPNTEFNNMALIDLARGCPHHCTFCWIGHNAPSYRIRPLDEILAQIDALAPFTPKMGLVASAVGAHPQIDDLCRELIARGLKVSYSSLRVEEVSPTMLEALAAGGGKTVTIAPEAGAPRVRKLMGKRISDEQIYEVSEKIFGLGAENMKLYFMIGVPSETMEEALEIATFTEKIRAIMLRHARSRGRIGQLGINLGVFVPKPNLPLNHIEPVPMAEIRKRLKALVQKLGRIPNVQVSASSPELARAQAVLSMGGLEAARYVMLVRAAGGDWRAANREWQRRHDATFAWKFERPRLKAAALHAR